MSGRIAPAVRAMEQAGVALNRWRFSNHARSMAPQPSHWPNSVDFLLDTTTAVISLYSRLKVGTFSHDMYGSTWGSLFSVAAIRAILHQL
jgi:hypothetical protein